MALTSRLTLNLHDAGQDIPSPKLKPSAVGLENAEEKKQQQGQHD